MNASMYVCIINKFLYTRISNASFKAIGEEKKYVVECFIASWQQLGCSHANANISSKAATFWAFQETGVLLILKE